MYTWAFTFTFTFQALKFLAHVLLLSHNFMLKKKTVCGHRRTVLMTKNDVMLTLHELEQNVEKYTLCLSR